MQPDPAAHCSESSLRSSDAIITGVESKRQIPIDANGQTGAGMYPNINVAVSSGQTALLKF